MTVVYNMFPALHVGSATGQVLAPATLTEIECVLPEETMAISDLVARVPGAMICANKTPSVSGIGTPVPEIDACMATTLKHFKSNKAPRSTKMPGGLAIAPTVQTVVVDRVAIVNPQFASIIRVDAEAVLASPMHSDAACPTHSK